MRDVANEGPVQVAPGVVRLGSVVNWYLVAEAGEVTVVDAGVPGYRPQLEAGLDLLGRHVGDIKAVLLTHGDLDHIGLAAAIQSEAGCPVYLHPADRELVHDGKRKKTERSMLTLLHRAAMWRTFGHFIRHGALRTPKVSDTVPLTPGETLDAPGHPSVVHVPGHTSGHVAFEFSSHGAAFVGDALITHDPLTGEPGPKIPTSAANVSSAEALRSLSAIEALEVELLLPGHGDPWGSGATAAVARARARGIS